MKYAALVALGSITEGPEKQKFLDVLSQALEGLINMYNDPSVKVREALSWLFSRICEHHFEIFADPAVAQEVIPCLMKGLQDKPRISNHSCAAFNHLASGHQPQSEDVMNNCLTPYYQQII